MPLVGHDSSLVLLIQTVQVSAFRTLVTALKDILLETNIVFSPEGVKIVNMDKSHTILAHMDLKSENFERFECAHDKIVVGVNMFHLFKLMSSVENDDTLTLFIDADDYADGVVQFLGLRFENGDIRQEKTQKLRLIEPEAEEIEMPSITFSSVLNMPSVAFQKIVRDLSSVSDKLELKSVATEAGTELIFSCSGTWGDSEVRRTESESLEFTKRQPLRSIIQGEFSLKYLAYFVKCTNLCSVLEMYLDNDRPLVVRYRVASLGEIKLCLAPLPRAQAGDPPTLNRTS